ncbi:hypothetical protein ARMGADRAFT_1029678 [Armillaria gallica]|uniref:Uncharacterized protein n=1 Tax=Armillaria gallica TaxID=47427 RepID=A0A2H3DEZ7_ARMGA|nr:hypothetical protein ARMGADRAFT_1029678 [Armillaria gallica]
MAELNDDVLDLIFDEVCREEASMVEVLEAVSLFGKGDEETEKKRLRARTLKWNVYRLDERTDGIPRYTTIHKVTFKQCTLGFPGLASLMQALPHLEGLKIAGRGTTIVPTIADLAQTKPSLTLSPSLVKLNVDCTHLWDSVDFRHFWGGSAGEDGNCLLSWLRNVANLSRLRIAMTGEIGRYQGNRFIQANRNSLLSLTLALEHPLQAWDFCLEVEAPELLDLMVSARSSPTDLHYIGAFFSNLESPKLNALTFHIHVLPISDDYPLSRTVRELDKAVGIQPSPAEWGTCSSAELSKYAENANPVSEILSGVSARMNGGANSSEVGSTADNVKAGTVDITVVPEKSCLKILARKNYARDMRPVMPVKYEIGWKVWASGEKMAFGRSSRGDRNFRRTEMDDTRPQGRWVTTDSQSLRKQQSTGLSAAQARDVPWHVVYAYPCHTARFIEPSMMILQHRKQGSLVNFQAPENVNRTSMSNIASDRAKVEKCAGTRETSEAYRDTKLKAKPEQSRRRGGAKESQRRTTK